MKNGSYYEGEFREDEIIGKGFKYDKEKDIEYNGEFLFGHYQGKGILRNGVDYVYKGDFFENVQHGYGELTDKHKQVYKGQWFYNKRHGQGIQHYADGSLYTGDWIRDKRQGNGELSGPYFLYDVRIIYIYICNKI